MKSILLHAWVLHKADGEYYLPYTHWIYLNEIVKYYDKVCLLSPIISKNKKEKLVSITGFDNVIVEALPPVQNYISAIKYFFHYCAKYRKLRNSYNSVYARYPVPFGWLQKVYMKNAERIIHFVGSPIEVTQNDPNRSLLKRKLLITLFMPEHILYKWACKGAKVYTNGFHIAEQLKKSKLLVEPVISSTLNTNDFYFEKEKQINKAEPKLIYLGYLLKAKGVEVVIQAYSLLLNDFPNAKLTIVGSGAFENELKGIVRSHKLENIDFKGHVDNRIELNHLLRNHDIFCFASQSEGSPRVILEAMANGLSVVSTPVGSLPFIFEENNEILFADFNNAEIFYDKIKTLINDSTLQDKIRKKAYSKVTDFTITKFIKKVFNQNS